MPSLKSPPQVTSTTTTSSPAALPSLISQILPLVSSSLPADKLTQIREILATHDLRHQGVIKGREIARAALQGKERRIAELEGRVVGLEGEREVLKGVVNGLKRKGGSTNGFWGADAGEDDEL
jgi:hypothetical protein